MVRCSGLLVNLTIPTAYAIPIGPSYKLRFATADEVYEIPAREKQQIPPKQTPQFKAPPQDPPQQAQPKHKAKQAQPQYKAAPAHMGPPPSQRIPQPPPQRPPPPQESPPQPKADAQPAQKFPVKAIPADAKIYKVKPPQPKEPTAAAAADGPSGDLIVKAPPTHAPHTAA